MRDQRSRDREVGHLDYKGAQAYERMSDDQIKEDIYDQLTKNPYIDASDIEIEVKDRHITLFGSVPDKVMKYSVEDIAESTPGVIAVLNKMSVIR